MDDGQPPFFARPAGPSLGTGTRRRLPPSHSPSSDSVCSPRRSPRPLSGVPAVRAGVRGVWSSRLLESHRRPGPYRGPAQSREQQLQALLRLREQQLFGRKTETSAATAPAASDAPHADSPPRQPRGQQRGGPSPKRRDSSTSLPLSKTRSCRPTSATARGVVSRSPISQAPRIPQSWRSMSGPIAESFAVAVIDRLARVVLIPASSPPRHRTG